MQKSTQIQSPYFPLIYAKNPSISTAAPSGIFPSLSHPGSFTWDAPSRTRWNVTFSFSRLNRNILYPSVTHASAIAFLSGRVYQLARLFRTEGARGRWSIFSSSAKVSVIEAAFCWANHRFSGICIHLSPMAPFVLRPGSGWPTVLISCTASSSSLGL